MNPKLSFTYWIKGRGEKANNHSHIGHTHKPDDPKIKKDKESQG